MDTTIKQEAGASGFIFEHVKRKMHEEWEAGKMEDWDSLEKYLRQFKALCSDSTIERRYE